MFKASRIRTKLFGLFLLTVAGALLELAGLALFVPLLLLMLDDNGITRSELLNRIYTGLDLSSYGIFLIIVSLAVLLFTLLKNFLLHRISLNRDKSLLNLFSELSKKLFTDYFKKGLLFIKQNSSSALSHNTNSVCYSYVFNVIGTLLNIAGDLLLTILIIVSLSFVNIYIALMEVLLFVPLILFFHMKMGGELQRAGKADNEAKKSQWRVAMETFRGYAEVEVNNAFPKLTDIFSNGLKAISESKQRADSLKSAASRLIEIGVVLVIIGVVVTSYYIGRDGNSFRILVGFFAIATLKLMPLVRSLVYQYSVVKANLYTIEIVNGTDSFRTISQDHSDVFSVKNDTEPLQFNRKIEFRNVSFGFDKSDIIIDNLSLIINKGEKVGIKGISGSGKSTIFYLMLGLYEPTAGGIYIDDILLTPQNRMGWHKQVGYVSQDIFVMDDTLAQNIILTGSADYDRLNTAIEQASLKKLVDSMPLGIESKIGDNGCRLSGGEKQRVAIARALYKKADVFLLDEPTSALDRKTEGDIVETLENPSFRGDDKTIVIISHTDSLLNICARVIDLVDY